MMAGGGGGFKSGGLVLGEAALGQRYWEGPGPWRLQPQQRFPGEQEGLAQLPGGQWNVSWLQLVGRVGVGERSLFPSRLTHNLISCT